MSDSKPSNELPESESHPKNLPETASKPYSISPPQKSAAGIPALLSSFHHIQSKTGIVRGVQTLLNLNQKEGFDCPGCAWPDPDDRRAMAEFCENGVKAIAEESTTRRITAEFFAKYSITELAEQTDYWLGQQGRLTEPMWLRPGSTHYEKIEWDQAFRIIAEELNRLDSPHEAVFYTSGRTSNEAAFLYQLFVRLFGTNNLPDCSNMCHESSGVALTESIGVGKGSVLLEDFEYADCILIIGQNPGTNHPRMLTSLQKAVRNGCQIISINPLEEAGLVRFKNPQELGGLLGKGTPLTSLFLQVRINGDVALLKGIMKGILLEETQNPGQVLDHEFIRDFTTGFEEFVEDIRTTPWEIILEESGISREEIQKAVQILSRSKKIICCWAMGLTQHKNAVANIQEAVNLLLLGGNLGRKGAGVCPVRGHSNVQGDRTMGIWEKIPDSFLNNLQNEFHFNPPREDGMDAVQSIHAMSEGKAKVFFGMGGNFLMASPDTNFTAKALQKCRLTAHVSTKLNRSHLVTGEQALILPCLGRTEEDLQNGEPQFVTVENSMGMVHKSKGKLKPASPHLKSEISIVALLAKTIFDKNPEKRNRIDWDKMTTHYDTIRDHISRVVPGFSNFNQKLKETHGFYLPHPVRDSRKFLTPEKKAVFKVHPIPRSNIQRGSYLLMTIRSHDQYNTTIYGMDDRYRGITHLRRVLLMNHEDMKEAGFTQETRVDITSHFDSEKRVSKNFIVISYPIPRQCVAAYFPEANELVPIGSTAEKSNTPTYKSILVTVAGAETSVCPADTTGAGGGG